jgi:hypothetical protein
VAPLMDGSILLFQGPRGVDVCTGTPLSRHSRSSSGRMVNVVKVLGQVGFTSERDDKVLPRGGGFKLGHKLIH